MITPQEYLEQLRAALVPGPTPTETIPAHVAAGRTVAGPVKAALAVPPFTNSAMDGFAVRANDLVGSGPWALPVVGDVPAGSVATAALEPGHAIRIMTGAPVPAGADTVVKVEDTDARYDAPEPPSSITITRAPAAGANVRHVGEDTPAGQVVLHAGDVLSALAPASLTAMGVRAVSVRRRPRLAVVSTGAELADLAEGAGDAGATIPDSDSLIVAALAGRAGAEVVRIVRSDDDPEHLWAALVDVAQGDADAPGAELVVTTGGISMGARDVVKQAGRAHGFTFASVGMQPGKPQGHGVLETPDGRRVGVVTLPGNPVSVAVSFTLFGVPVLRDMLGLGPAPRWFATAGANWSAPRGRRQYLPARLEPSGDAGAPRVTPVHERGSASHLVAALHAAQVLAVVPADVSAVHVGDVLEVIPLQ